MCIGLDHNGITRVIFVLGWVIMALQEYSVYWPGS